LKARGRTRTFAVAHDLETQTQLGLARGNLSMFSEANYSLAVRPPLVVDFNTAAAVPVFMRATVNVYASQPRPRAFWLQRSRRRRR